MYSLVFTRLPGESYFGRFRSLLYLCYVFRALINTCELILFVGYLLTITIGKNYLVTMLITITKHPAWIMMEPCALKHNCSESTVISNLLSPFLLLLPNDQCTILLIIVNQVSSDTLLVNH